MHILYVFVRYFNLVVVLWNIMGALIPSNLVSIHITTTVHGPKFMRAVTVHNTTT